MKTGILALDWVLHSLKLWHDLGDRDGNGNMLAV